MIIIKQNDKYFFLESILNRIYVVILFMFRIWKLILPEPVYYFTIYNLSMAIRFLKWPLVYRMCVCVQYLFKLLKRTLSIEFKTLQFSVIKYSKKTGSVLLRRITEIIVDNGADLGVQRSSSHTSRRWWWWRRKVRSKKSRVPGSVTSCWSSVRRKTKIW